MRFLKKALIVHGTRYGATEMTSEEIADIFRQEGLDVKVINLKKSERHNRVQACHSRQWSPDNQMD